MWKLDGHPALFYGSREEIERKVFLRFMLLGKVHFIAKKLPYGWSSNFESVLGRSMAGLFVRSV